MNFFNKGMLLCAFLITQSLFSWLVVDLNSEKARLLNTEEMRFCYISFINIEGKRYLIKQKKSDCLRKLLGVVRDAVLAHFAEGFIPAHRIEMIPPIKFIGKPRADWPATIHTIAPGKMLKEQNSPYNGMNLKQAEVGVTPEMLSWAADVEVLLKILVYDTFFCNHDRHRGNLFYDSSTDSFCAIDMDSAWKNNLCALAIEKFNEMLASRNFYLKTKQMKALVKYKEYLQFLIANHPPKETIKIYDYFVQKAGFVEGADFYIPKFRDEIIANKRMIQRSYEDAQKLVKIIEKVIEKAKVRKQAMALYKN